MTWANWFRKAGTAATNKPTKKRANWAGVRVEVTRLEDRVTPVVTSQYLGGTFAFTSGKDVVALSGSENFSEMFIAQSPVNPGSLAITSNNFVTDAETTAFSGDAGKTWTRVDLGKAADGQTENGNPRFDGSVVADKFGYFHAVYQTGSGELVHALSVDGGKTYAGTLVTSDSSLDKPWVAVGPDAQDPTMVAVFITWSQNSGGQKLSATAATIDATGKMSAFATPVVMSTNTAAGANYSIPAVGPNGEFVATYMSPSGGQGNAKLLFNRDLDGLKNGLTFGQDTVPTTSNVGGFDFNPATPDRSAFAQPFVTYDRSNGPFRGRLYLAYAEEPVDESNNMQILVRRSDDNGTTWSAPVQASDKSTNVRFFQTISVDETTGAAWVGFYDGRNAPGNNKVEFYVTASVDGGVTFLPNAKVADGPSDEALADPDGNDFGDYTGFAAFGGSGFGLWADNFNGTKLKATVDRVVLTASKGQVITATGTAGADRYIVRRDPTGTYIQVYENVATPTGQPASTATVGALTGIVIDALAGDDTVVLDYTNGDPIAGLTFTFNGGAGKDKIAVVADTDFTLTDKSLTVGTLATFNLSGVEQVGLTGGAGNNTFTVSGFTGTVTIDGAAGKDTIVAQKDVNFTLTNASLATTDGMVAVLTSVEAAQLVGGPGANSFNPAGFAGTVDLDGQAGADTYIIDLGSAGGTIGESGTDKATDTLLIRGTSGNDTFSLTSAGITAGAVTYPLPGGKIEVVSIDALGGDDAVTVDASTFFTAGTTTTFDGGSGTNTATLFGTPATKVARAVVSFSGTADATLVFDPDGSGGPVLNTAPGADAVTYSFAGFQSVGSGIAADAVTVLLPDNAGAIAVANGAPINAAASVSVAGGGRQVRLSNVRAVDVTAGAGGNQVVVDVPQRPAGLSRLSVFPNRLTDAGPNFGDGSANTFEVRAAAFDALELFGDVGDDAFVVGALPAVAGGTGTDAVTAALTLAGNGGTDALTVSDFGSAGGNADVRFTPTAVTGILGLAGKDIGFAGFASLTVIGSNAVAAEKYTIDAFALPLTLSTAGGPDTVVVNNQTQPFGLDTGDGDDTISFTAADFAGGLVVSPGAGNDRVSFAGSKFGGGLTVNGGAGNDTLAVGGTTATFVLFDGGDGDDAATVSLPGGKVTVLGGAGVDSFDNAGGPLNALSFDAGAGGGAVKLTGVTLPGGVVIASPDGPLTVSLSAVTAPSFAVTAAGGPTTLTAANVTGPLSVATSGAGATTVNATAVTGAVSLALGDGGGAIAVTGAGPTTVAAGNGANVVNVANSGPTSVTTGSGNDTVDLTGTAGTIATGGGNDTVTVGGTTPGTVSVDAGAGTDAITATATAGTLALTGGDGDDAITVTLTAQTAGGGLFVVAGAGNDVVRIPFAPVGSDISTGAGNDAIAVGIASAGTSINAGDGDDFLSLGGTTGGGTVTVVGGAGNDNFANTGKSAGAFAGTVNVNGEGGTDTLTLDDSANAADTTYRIDRSGLTAGSAGGLNLSGFEATGLAAGGGKNTFTVAGSPAGGLTVTDGAGASTFDIAGDQLAGTVSLAGGGGDDTYNVAAGAGITAAGLTLDGEAGTDKLAVTGKTGDDALVFTFGGTPTLTGLGLTLALSGLDTLTLDGGSGNNALTVADDTNTAYGTILTPQTGVVIRPTAAGAGGLTVGGTKVQLTYTNFRNGLTYNGDTDGSGDRDTVTVLAFSGTGAGGTGALANATAANGIDRVTVSDGLVDIENESLGRVGAIRFATAKTKPTVAAIYVKTGTESGPMGDTVNVTPSANVNIVIDAGGPTVKPGDILQLNAVGSTTVEFVPGTSPALGPPQTRITVDDTGASVGAIGFEQSPAVATYAVATGAGVSSQVVVYDSITGKERRRFAPFEESFVGGVSVASGDVTGDGVTDTVVGAGAGAGPRVQVFDGVTGAAVSNFFPYEMTFTGGVQVSAADVNGDGFADIILGTGVGGGPRAQVISGKDGTTLMNFFAYESGFRNGVQVAAGDVNGDGVPDVVTGSGVGGGPRARAFSGVNGQVLADFFAYDGGLRFGVNVAAGDVDGDGIAEIITGPGSFGVPNVRVYRTDGSLVTDFYVDDVLDRPAAINSFPLDAGVRVGAVDLDGDRNAEILVGQAAGTRPVLHAFDIAGGTATSVRQLSVFDDGFAAGIFVG